jgi:hypothetical protein
MKRNLSSGIGTAAAALAMLGLSACATQQGPRPVATVYAASSDTQVASRGAVAGDDLSMKQKSSKEQTASASSTTTATKEESQSTETTTVVGSTPVAAPDSEVKSNQ